MSLKRLLRKITKKTPIDWNLDYEFLKWLNKWFKEYRKNASKVIDLEFREYNYLGQTMTQLQIIDRIIELTDRLTDKYFAENDNYEMVDEVFSLFRLVYWDMWW